MATFDLRPLSLGEILDRSFTLYRGNFPLFFGIAAIPQFLVLALSLAQLFLNLPSLFSPRNVPAARVLTGPTSILIGIVSVIVGIVAYLLSQAATVSAVADLSLGRATTIGESFRKVRGRLFTLFFVAVLNLFVMLGGFALFIFPGFYMVCRLLVAVPAAVVENLGPRQSLDRSFHLTRKSAGRAFVVLLLYFVLLLATTALFTWPPTIAIAASRNNPSLARFWTAIMEISNSVGAVLVAPVLTIAISGFYFDLRVRKEAFDLQMMLDPAGVPAATPAGDAPGMLS